MARVKGSPGVNYCMKKYDKKMKSGKIPIKEISKNEWKKYDIKKMENQIKKMRMKRLMNLSLLIKLACKTTKWMEFLKMNIKEIEPGYYETEYMCLNRIRKQVIKIYKEEFGGTEIDKYPELIEPVDKDIDEEGYSTLHFN